MPIYEYRCEECNNTFELLESFSAEPIKKCVECGGEARRVISSSSFILKGSGWYLTDYARKKEAPQCPKGNGKDTSSSNPEKACNTCPSGRLNIED